MIYTKWVLFIVAHIVIKVVAWSMAGVAVRWFSTEDKRQLRRPFRWMMTKDADLGGDRYWLADLAARGADPLADENRIAWMRRNGGHAANYALLGVDVDQAWLECYRNMQTGEIVGGPIWETDDAFCLRGVWLGLEVCAGWNLLGPQNGRAKIWFSVRRAK